MRFPGPAHFGNFSDGKNQCFRGIRYHSWRAVQRILSWFSSQQNSLHHGHVVGTYCCVTLLSAFSGLRNPPRLLVAGPSSTGSSDSDGGLFAVPTTLPPNSRHGKLFSPSKEAELTFRQHLNSISVSARSYLYARPGSQHLAVWVLRAHMLFALQMQSDFFLPKPRKLRNRHLRKPLVVQVRDPCSSSMCCLAVLLVFWPWHTGFCISDF